MENQIWDDEVSNDNDEAIARLEAEIANEKAFLSSLSDDDDLF